MIRVALPARPEPAQPAAVRPLAKSERDAREARKLEILQRRKAAGYGLPATSSATITK